MANYYEELAFLEELLQVKLPEAFRKFWEKEGGANSPDGLLDLAFSMDIENVWGATEYLRTARMDLGTGFVAIKVKEARFWCLDLSQANAGEAPVVAIDLEPGAAPQKASDSFGQFLQMAENCVLSEKPREVHNGEDYWFRKGLQRLDWHMQHLTFRYDHKAGGQLPRGHIWRPYRFCVQDVILGLTVIRHDRKFNRLEVDVFLTAQIPEYEVDSGCRALTLICLCDAYKSGGSMEIKFTRHVRGRRVPRELCLLAEKLGVNLSRAEEGGITPREAKRLFLALSGLREEVGQRVIELEEAGRISAASVCYAMHHGVWTAAELEVILYGSLFPDTILRGSFPPETWHLYNYDLFQARNAIMGGYLDRDLLRREHRLREKTDLIVELEDDERQVDISFDPQSYAKVYSIAPEEKPLPLSWLYQNKEETQLQPGHKLWVLLRCREHEDLVEKLGQDLEEALMLKKTRANPQDQVCVMVSADFRLLETAELVRQAAADGLGLLVCPEFLSQLDQEVTRRFEAVKVMRQ